MFKSQNFCHVASNNRNNVKAGVFIYRTTDDLATVTASGYFNERIIDINLHDLIIHEKINASDNTKVERNVLCVTERTLSNVGTIVVKSKWEGDIEQAIEDLRTYVDNTFLKLDGTSTMTGVLKMRASVSFECAIAPYWHGVGLYQLNDNDSVTLLASMEATDGWCPSASNTYNMGSTYHKWKNLYLAGKAFVSTINNGFDIAVPVTNSADTLALKSQVDLAANSGSQLYTTGVWYAKMYSASTVPTGAEYDGKNYADFSQVDGDNNPIIVIYEGQSGAWVQIDTITPPATYNGYITVTSKIWDIAEQTDQQGGEVLWSYNQKTFTPYPKIVSLLNQANIDLDNLTAIGANIANWSSNVTNCIVEIPQDIKMELNNGTLTLKAGSRIYLKSDTTTPSVIIENDLTTTQTTDTQYFAIYNGSTFTTVTTTAYNYGSLPNTYSYPLALITVSGGKISSIDQMFNGFSYIGSTVLCFPNVKYIIPNGRDVNNNMLNQTKTTTFISSVSYNSYNTGKRCLVLDNSGSLISYNNTYYRYDSNDIFTDSFVNTVAEIGTCVVNSGDIQSINIIKPFQIVGYNDTKYITYDANETYPAGTVGAEISNLKSYPKVYVASGFLFNSVGDTCEGYGTATVSLYPNGIARVDFNIKITTSGTSSSNFQCGLNRDLLSSINSNIPTITPIKGGSLTYYATSGSVTDNKMDYGGLMTSVNQFWQPARIYDTSGSIGSWGADQYVANQRIIGVCYGTFSV